MSKRINPQALAIGERIRTARKDAGLSSPEDLADIVKVHVSTITSYERGEKWPYKYIRPIAEATNRSVQWLLYGQDFEGGLAEIRGHLAELLERVPELPVTANFAPLDDERVDGGTQAGPSKRPGKTGEPRPSDGKSAQASR